MQIVDWREKLKKEAENDNPINKWKKFDSGVKKTIRPPPQKPKPKTHKAPKEDPCTCNVGNCKVHSKFALSLKSTTKKNSATNNTNPEPAKPEETLKRKPSVKKRSDNNPLSKLSKTDSEGKTGSKPSSRASSVVPEDEKVEVIKIINFVAIKVTMKASEVQKNMKLEEPVTAKPVASAPTTTPNEKDLSSQSCSLESSSSPSPPPPPREPTPPPPPKPPSPPPPEPTVFVKIPSPEPLIEETPEPLLKSPSPEKPLSPVYQRKFFPNPEPMEPYKPKIRDYTPTTVKLKRTEEYFEEAPPSFKRQFSSDLDVAPVKFSSSKDNCVKKALFVGDQYMGDNTEEFHVSYNLLGVPKTYSFC